MQSTMDNPETQTAKTKKMSHTDRFKNIDEQFTA